jgi:hypothetical protein
MSGRQFRALLIGNGSYSDPDGVLQPLKGPKNDVTVLRDALTNVDYGLFDAADVSVRTDLDRTKLAEELYDFVDRASSDDMLLIYFSGHGERVAGQQLGLCGVDIQHSKRETACFKASELQTWIVERNRARSTVIVLDCCYSGIFKGAAVAEDELAATFGEGTIVLSSGGNQVSKDAPDDESPSPFTAALVEALLDPALGGDDAGWVSPQAVYDQLLRRAPALVPEPKIRAEIKGRVPLAKRRREDAPPAPLIGWMEEQDFDTIDIEIGASSVVVRYTSDGDEPRDLAALDDLRRMALQLLAELADGVARSPAYAESERLRQAVMRTWTCIGSNLLETTVPPGLRSRLAALDSTGRNVVKLRLGFTDDARDLAGHPWELLRLADAQSDEERPLALQRGLLLERVVRTTTRQTRRSSTSPSVVVFNAYEGSFGKAGRRISAELADAPGVLVFKDVHGADATFAQFVSVLDLRPQYLVLCAPVRRDGQHSELGFAKAHSGPEDFRPTKLSVLDQIVSKDMVFDAIVLVTFAAPPGEDSYRAVHDVAATLAEAGRGPVVFACHSPGYESYLEDDEKPTFPGLLLDALSREPDRLDRCFWYAREWSMTHAQPRQQEAFGVPGCYVSSEPAPSGTGKVAPSSGVLGNLGSIQQKAPS